MCWSHAETCHSPHQTCHTCMVKSPMMQVLTKHPTPHPITTIGSTSTDFLQTGRPDMGMDVCIMASLIADTTASSCLSIIKRCSNLRGTLVDMQLCLVGTVCSVLYREVPYSGYPLYRGSLFRVSFIGRFLIQGVLYRVQFTT